MKRKALTTIIAVLTGLFAFSALPQKAEAGHNSYQRRTVNNCGHCHSPVYAYRVLSYYDSCGRPQFRWVTHSHSRCGSRSRSHQSYGNSYYYGGSRYRGGSYQRRDSSCRPRSGWSFSFRL